LNNSIFVAFNDSMSSKGVINFLVNSSFSHDKTSIILCHLFRKPSASEELMGKTFGTEMESRLKNAMENARERLVEKGFEPGNIEIDIILEPYPTLADGVIDQCIKRKVDMVIIGRKKMSKAEEFVMGDLSVKLVRNLDGVAVLVIKSP
jgi:nucleotide-binding universal stress UspA family protein